MPQQRHIIKQQRLDLRIPSNIKAFELQTQLSALYRSKIVPLIEAYCNQLSDPDTILRIDTLDIDLGEIDLQTLESDFVAKVKDPLYQQLVEKISPLAASPAPRPTVNADQATPPTAGAKPKPPANPPASQLELFSYFIRTGRLPWWSNALSQQALEDCCEQLLRTSPAALKALLQNQLRHANPLQRLIYQYSDQTLISLATLLVPTGYPWLQTYTQDIQTLAPQLESLRGIPPRQFRLQLWQGILGRMSLNPTPHPSPSSAIRDNLLHLAASFQVKASTLRRQMLSALERLRSEGVRFDSDLPAVLADRPPTAATTNILFRAAINNLVSLLSRLKKNLDNEQPLSSSLRANIDVLLRQFNSLLRNPPSDSSNSPSIDTLLTEIAALVVAIEAEAQPTYRPQTNQIRAVVQSIKQSANPQARPPEASLPPKPFNDPVEPFSESEEIYVQNAGLILLWPFLNRFFETLNLVQANRLINPQATERAVLLLQYLVNAATEIPEHLLPLNKLLCGLDLLGPISARLEITEAEQTECNTLLTAVIHNWSALKNTTPDGFRQAFLQRAGILRLYNGNWLLQVERKTYDVLLDQLPWSIRLIKLPWMAQILFTEW